MSTQEDYTLNRAVGELNDSWRTEVNSPEILPFRSELVDFIKTQLDRQQENIDRRVDAKNEGEYFTTTVYQMDIERVRYSLSRYLRSRVLKIEKCLEFINSHMDVFDRLSDEEKVFASKLNTLNNSYFEDVVATRLVAEAREYYESSDDRVKNAEPSFQDFVFCKSLVDIKNLQIADQNQDIGEGTIIIVQYAAVRNHVLEGEVILL